MHRTKYLFVLVSLFLAACSTDLSMHFPQGPEGPAGNDGKSAYELWVDEVKNGNIPWNIDETELSDFFRYLKGKDGENGQNGQDGQNGKSAYELWLIEVAKGIEDPHNPGTNWDKSKTDIHDFFWFLTGKDGMNGQNGQNGQPGKPGQNGLSAYELWVKDVADGLENPHDRPNEWPKDETSMDDFWRYLRGQDGAPGGGTGNPGEETPIIMGKPNVIAQFSSQANNEYVNWVEGSVSYIVYDDSGQRAPNAVVSGLPGIDPSKVFKANSDGEIIVPKDDLPVNLNANQRWGYTQSVTYVNSLGQTVTERSAYNTYVPNRIFVRIRLASAPRFLINDNRQNIHHKFMRLECIVERQVDNDPWQQIPNYLGDLNQNIIAYELSDPTDPSSYSSTSTVFYNSNSHFISNNVIIDMIRPTKRYSYMPLSYQETVDLWDGNDHYFNIILDKYYGEVVHANSSVKIAPVQFVPMVKNLVASGLSGNSFNLFTGEFDTSDIDYDLLFNEIYDVQTRNSGLPNEYLLYEPIVSDRSTYSDVKTFRIKFTFIAGGSQIDASNADSPSTIGSPTFEINIPVHTESSIELHSHSQYFRSLPLRIGRIVADKDPAGNVIRYRIQNNPDRISRVPEITYIP